MSQADELSLYFVLDYLLICKLGPATLIFVCYVNVACLVSDVRLCDKFWGEKIGVKKKCMENI